MTNNKKQSPTHDCENNIESNNTPAHCRICGEPESENNTQESLKEMREDFLIKSELKGKIGEMMLDNLLSKQAEEISEAVLEIDTKYHICRFNDGEQDCECYNAALSDTLLAIKQIINK